jgi:hypothetical protein
VGPAFLLQALDVFLYLIGGIKVCKVILAHVHALHGNRYLGVELVDTGLPPPFRLLLEG